MPAKLSLTLNPTLSPPFHEASFEDFQRLCRELLNVEHGIKDCELYGVNGERQRGIDLVAKFVDGDETVAAQCQCQTAFTPGQMRKAVKAFLDHWDFWRGWGVRRFIILVAWGVSWCNASVT